MPVVGARYAAPHAGSRLSAPGIGQARVIAHEGSARGLAAGRTLERQTGSEREKTPLGAGPAARQERAKLSDPRVAEANRLPVPGVREGSPRRSAVWARGH